MFLQPGLLLRADVPKARDRGALHVRRREHQAVRGRPEHPARLLRLAHPLGRPVQGEAQPVYHGFSGCKCRCWRGSVRSGGVFTLGSV